VEFRVLGPLEVRRDGVAVDVGGARQRTVLSRLLIARGEVVGVDRLLHDLWDGEPTPSALGVLQAYVSHLRRALEPDRKPRAPATVLVSRAPGYVLYGWSDADRFAELVHRGIEELSTAQPAAAMATLDEAIGLWRGAAYADVADEPWAAPEAARLEELLLVAREHRLAAALSLGQAHASVPELERLVGEHPLREGLWRLLALALYRTARQADALDALRRARTLLAEELGLDPSPALRQLEQAILDHAPDLGESVPLADLAGATSTDPATRAPAATPAPADVMVGRSAQLAEIRHAADEVLRSGRPRSVVVVGSAGIGKSRLLDQADLELRGAGWTVATARCHETSGAPALWPWLQILGELDVVAPLPPDLAALVSGTAADHAQPADASAARFRQHESIRRYLTGVAQQRPLLVVIDDVQWADAASAQLLGDLFALSRTGQILAVAATRPRDDDAHADTWVRLDRAGGRRIALTGLTAEDLEQLAAAAGHPLPGSVLLERTGGNPFFARETLRLVGTLGERASLSQVPDSVGDLLRQRLGQLPPEAQTVLQVASVLGRDVDVDLLATVSGQAAEEVWEAVEAGVLFGVLVDGGDGGLHFAHDLVRETLYRDMAPLRRIRVHARAVEVLEQSPVPDVSQLAEHARAAGTAARESSVRWSVAAAEEARARLAHADAARWWSCAVDAHSRLPDADPRARVELLLSLLRAQLDSGDVMAARDSRALALVAADAIADVGLSARALVSVDAPAMWLLKRYDDVELGLVARLERALDELTDDDELRCRLTATLAAELYDGSVDPRCETLSAAAVETARRLGDPALLAYALNMRYLATNRGHVVDERVAIGRELVAIGTGHGLPAFALLGHQLLTDALLSEFDVAGSDEHARAAERLNARLDLAVPQMQTTARRASRLMLDGRFDEALAFQAEFRRILRTWWAAEDLSAAITVETLLLADRADEIEPGLLDRAAVVMPTVAHDIGGLLAATTGARTRPALDWTSPSRDWAWLTAMLVRAHVAAEVGPPDVRRATYDELLPYAARMAVTAAIAVPVGWYLGRLAESLGDPAAARCHYLELADRCARESLPWWAERARAAAQVLA
jgi:DNA-binding SARP family transcriptional activator